MMKKHSPFLLLLAVLFSGAADLPPEAPVGSSPPFRPNKDYALFFAVNDYDQWPDLANPVSEVEAVAKDLHELYGFETEIVRNPDRISILDKIEVYRQKTFASDGQLLIFFSGHGEFNERTKQGFFVPKNGLKKDVYGDSYIEYESLKRRITSLPCNHILLALDACYSGTADEGIAMKGDPGTRPGNNKDAERQRYISSSLQYKSRIMLTSGAKVRTPDKSAFVAKFLEALRSQGGSDGLINLPELMGYLSTALPQPVLNKFGDHEPGGEFLFIGKNIPGNELTPISDRPTNSFNADIDDRAFEKAKNRNTSEAYEDYLDVFPNGRHRAQALEKSKMPVVTTNGMLLVKGGSFLMGGGEYDHEKPAHTVEISDFYLAAKEVTNAQYCAFLNEKGNQREEGFTWIDDKSHKDRSIKSRITKSNKRFVVEPGYGDYPVAGVTWFGAKAYCDWLSAKSAGKMQYRLPTEAEWEYAAGGGNLIEGTIWVGTSDEAQLYKYDNTQGSSYKDPYEDIAPVGVFQSNALGIFDMGGNVSEWCSDLYDPEYYKKSPIHDPVGPPLGLWRVVRGCSYGGNSKTCLIVRRNRDNPWSQSIDTGFRPAATIRF